MYAWGTCECELVVVLEDPVRDERREDDARHGDEVRRRPHSLTRLRPGAVVHL